MNARFQYIRPQSLEEGLEILRERGPQTAVLAGGTDLMIAVRKGNLSREFVLDVSGLNELRTVAIANGRLSVGAALTYSEIINNDQVISFAPVLAKAARCVGSLQIRNMGTLGGNAANASPAADAVTALIAHDAQVEIVSARSTRLEALADFIVGPYSTILRPDELITRFILEPLGNTHRFTFQRIARRRTLSIARMNIAAIGRLSEDGSVADLRMSVGSVTPRPSRMTVAEQALLGKMPSGALIREAAKRVSDEMIHRSGVRPSTEYKRPAVEGLVIKALSDLFLG